MSAVPVEAEVSTDDGGARPLVGVSRCLGFDACRWDGAIVPSAEVAELLRYVELRSVCPEVEKDDFLALIERYRWGQAPLSACLATLRSWVARFGQPYLAGQTYLHPYPEGLVRDI